MWIAYILTLDYLRLYRNLSNIPYIYPNFSRFVIKPMDFSRLCLAYIWKSWIFFLFYPIFLIDSEVFWIISSSASYHSCYLMLVVNVTYSTLTATCIFASSLVCSNCSIKLFRAVGYWIRISKIQIAIEYFVHGFVYIASQFVLLLLNYATIARLQRQWTPLIRYDCSEVKCWKHTARYI